VGYSDYCKVCEMKKKEDKKEINEEFCKKVADFFI